jgi:hypothetical protein
MKIYDDPQAINNEPVHIRFSDKLRRKKVEKFFGG